MNEEHPSEDLLDGQNCDAYINKMMDNFYKLWTYHFKYQHPANNSDENIRCFVQEIKKWQLHDRYLLDLLLRDNESSYRRLFRRNNIIYERLREEAVNNCNLQ